MSVADLLFQRPDGSALPLSAFAGRPLLVIFLRHLAWIPCRAHLGEVQVHYDEFRQLGAEVLIVTQARPEMLTLFVRDLALPFPIVADPTRQAYRAFGLSATRWTTFLRPGVLLRYLRLMFGGWKLRKPSGDEDVLQLGGDFVLDRSGRIVFAYRSREPTDRPGLAALLQAVRRAAIPN